MYSHSAMVDHLDKHTKLIKDLNGHNKTSEKLPRNTATTSNYQKCKKEFAKLVERKAQV